ncbi:ATP-dependent dethiobiotin synthetase BioD [Spirochaetota bacterium]|nr:ATP-dependent dethiobiotin synthetase BioD [Spirochaetota bacterium]
MNPLFILGTDTGVGKTFLASLLFAYHEASHPGTTLYVKPFQTGVKGTPLPSDAETVHDYMSLRATKRNKTSTADSSTIDKLIAKNATSSTKRSLQSLNSRLLTLTSYRLPAAPHLAAAYDHKPLNNLFIETLIEKLCKKIADFHKNNPTEARVIIEGSGGVLVPLTGYTSYHSDPIRTDKTNIDEPKTNESNINDKNIDAPKANNETNIMNTTSRKNPVINPIMLADFVRQLNKRLRVVCKNELDVVLVGKTALGTLNHTLLSCEALAKRQIPIKAIFLNDYFLHHGSEPQSSMQSPSEPDPQTLVLNDNEEFLARLTGLPVHRFKAILSQAMIRSIDF